MEILLQSSSEQSQTVSNNRDAQIDKVSHQIRTIREALGISQADMAKALEVDRSNYHRMERRGEKLTVEQLNQIASILDVSVTELISSSAPTNEEILTDQQMVSSLKQRVAELEDRLRDKQFLSIAYSRILSNIAEDIHEFFFATALDMGIVSLSLPPDLDDVQKQIMKEVWLSQHNRVRHVTQQNDKGEWVYTWGDLQLTESDFKRIFQHILETDKNLSRMLPGFCNTVSDSLPGMVFSEQQKQYRRQRLVN